MNPFTAKKLGEVLGFCEGGLEIFSKGQKALKELLSEKYQPIIDELNLQSQEIKKLTEKSSIEEITLPKAQTTKTKLGSLAEFYIGDEWDNKAEVLEWLGFFEGAAIIHWQLVSGSATGLNNKDLKKLAVKNIKFHTSLFNLFASLIKDLAIQKTGLSNTIK